MNRSMLQRIFYGFSEKVNSLAIPWRTSTQTSMPSSMCSWDASQPPIFVWISLRKSKEDQFEEGVTVFLAVTGQWNSSITITSGLLTSLLFHFPGRLPRHRIEKGAHCTWFWPNALKQIQFQHSAIWSCFPMTLSKCLASNIPQLTFFI